MSALPLKALASSAKLTVFTRNSAIRKDDDMNALNFKSDYAEVYVARGSVLLKQNNDRDGAIRE